jgi:dTDP-4-amino-4,6-dideoxygalactose transaminase
MKKIFLNLAHMGGEEIEYVRKAFDDDWVAPLGPNVDGFEEDLKQYLGGEKEVLALSSGTAAVHLGLVACGVKEGDEVIAQSFTFCASVNPILYLGAKPVLVGSEDETWNMAPDLLEEAIVDRIAKTGRKPKAIVPVSLYGMPYEADRIMEIAGRYGIAVVEDSAEALGSTFDGHPLGTFGNYGVLSFNGNKIITTSGGGALICPDAQSKEKMLYYATQARGSYPFYQHEDLGYNYRMSNVCAGIGRGQMSVLKAHIDRHREIARMYAEHLGSISGIRIHGNPSPRIESNFWLSSITLDPGLHVIGQENVKELSGDICAPNPNVEALRVMLDKAGIESRSLWKPMHLQPLYKDAPMYDNAAKVSESLFKTGLCLPSGPRVSDEDVRYICETIREALIR